MCKGCQYCFESCYWHLIEKNFCYDENIALYEEPTNPSKHNNSFENMAFYDQVSLIAGRAIVTIDPLPTKPKPIEHQPARRIRWWEDNIDEQNKENEAKNNQNRENLTSITTIMESSREDLTSSTDEVDSVTKKENASTDTTSSEEIKEKREALIAPRKITSTLALPEQIKIRKKSLRERRMSRSLTLNIDRNLELPIIRQVSIPKFYIDTPEANQIDASVLMIPSTALTSPIMPRTSPNDYFDLRSIVQMENEIRANQQNPAPVHKQPSPHFRLSQIKEKLKAAKIKRQGSATNLPNSIQHI